MGNPFDDLIASHAAGFPPELIVRLGEAMEAAYDMGREHGLEAAALADRYAS